MHLESPSPIKVKSFQVGTTVIRSKLGEFLSQPHIKTQFLVSEGTRVKVTNKACSDDSGCACANNDRATLDKICQYQQCDAVQCATPVAAVGQCCPLCGSVLTLQYDPLFRLERLRQEIARLFTDEGATVIIAKVTAKRVQIVVLDSSDGEAAKSVGARIHRYLKTGPGRQQLSVRAVKVSASGRGFHASHVVAKKSGHVTSIVGIVLSLLVVALLIALAMYCFMDGHQWRRMRSKLPAKLFHPFSAPADDSVEMTTGDINYIDIMSQQQQTTFDNPMYDVNDAIDKTENNNEAGDGPAVIDASSVTFSVNKLARGNSFSNPLFEQQDVAADSAHLHADLSDSTI